MKNECYESELHEIAGLMNVEGVTGTITKIDGGHRVLLQTTDRQGYKKTLEGTVTNSKQSALFAESFRSQMLASKQ